MLEFKPSQAVVDSNARLLVKALCFNAVFSTVVVLALGPYVIPVVTGGSSLLYLALRTTHGDSKKPSP